MNETVCLLHARKYNFVDDKTQKNVSGVTFHYVPLLKENDAEQKGYDVKKITSQNQGLYDSVMNLPAKVELVFEVSMKYSKPQLKLTNIIRQTDVTLIEHKEK